MSPDQRNALREFVRLALNHDPSCPFPNEHIRWADEPNPPPDATYCVIDPQDSETISGPSEQVEKGTTHADHQTMVRDLHSQVVSFTVYAKPSESAPAHRQRADVILDELRARVFATWVSQGVRDVGLAPMDVGPVSDQTRYHRNSQWQTVAELTVTFARATVIYHSPGTIDRVSGTGTTVPATGSNINFDAQE